MIVRSAFALCFLFLTVPAGAIPLEDIPALVDRHNEEVGAARKDVEAGHDAILAVQLKHLPSVHWKNTFIHLKDDIRLVIPPQTLGPITVAPPPITLQRQDIFLSTLIATWPLFAGGRIVAGVAGATAQRDESSATLRKTSQEKTREAISRYFGAQLAKRVAGILESMNGTLDHLREISETMLKTGLGTKFAVLQIKVAQADLRSRLAEARGKVTLADLAFKTSVGVGEGEVVTYDSPPRKIPLPNDIAALKKDALARRSEFDLLRAKGDQVSALRRLNVGEMLPTVAVVGAQQLTSALPTLEPKWAVGITIDIPLTNWIGGLAERERAVKLGEKVEILKARAAQDIPLEVEKIYRDAEAALAAYAATEEGHEMAKEAMRLAEMRFRTGDGSAVELLRATTDLETSEIRELRLLDDYNQKLLDLYRAAGDVGRFLAAYGEGKS